MLEKRYTYEEIGEALGVSKQRAYQLTVKYFTLDEVKKMRSKPLGKARKNYAQGRDLTRVKKGSKMVEERSKQKLKNKNYEP